MQKRSDRPSLGAAASQAVTGQDNIALQNIIDSDIQVIFARIGEPELARLAELIAERRPELLSADEREMLKLLRTTLGLTDSAIAAFFRILGGGTCSTRAACNEAHRNRRAV